MCPTSPLTQNPTFQIPSVTLLVPDLSLTLVSVPENESDFSNRKLSGQYHKLNFAPDFAYNANKHWTVPAATNSIFIKHILNIKHKTILLPIKA